MKEKIEFAIKIYYTFYNTLVSRPYTFCEIMGCSEDDDNAYKNILCKEEQEDIECCALNQNTLNKLYNLAGFKYNGEFSKNKCKKGRYKISPDIRFCFLEDMMSVAIEEEIITNNNAHDTVMVWQFVVMAIFKYPKEEILIDALINILLCKRDSNHTNVNEEVKKFYENVNEDDNKKIYFNELKSYKFGEFGKLLYVTMCECEKYLNKMGIWHKTFEDIIKERLYLYKKSQECIDIETYL